MNTICKYPIEIEDEPAIHLPVGARVLAVQVQGDRPFIWALVDPDAPTVPRFFLLRATGAPCGVAIEHGVYIGTFQSGRLVFHLFERERLARASRS